MDAEELQILRAANLLPDLSELIAQDENILRRMIEEYQPNEGEQFVVQKREL